MALALTHPIDGVIDFSELNLSTSQIQMVDLSNSANSSIDVEWGILNDDKDLYFAARWTDASRDNQFSSSATQFDGIALEFDSNHNGNFDSGDDAKRLIAVSVGSLYRDLHQESDYVDDAIGNGRGKLVYDSANHQYTAEFILPLAGNDVDEDGNLTDNSKFNIVLYDGLNVIAPQSGKIGKYSNTSASDSWLSLSLPATEVHARPTLPENLGGLIAFISSHENPTGDIYTYNPATEVVTRVTNSSMFKGNVSLSHDRTKIAFHGAPSESDFAHYEIYRIDVDGNNLTQLTNNSILDGHPAWSPDDSQIAYASFRDGNGKASIITMNSDDGSEIADLTPANTDDNDPEYLPNGKIVFKTDRFQNSPQVQIALMNDDGSGVSQLTRQSGVSDHDPAGTNNSVLLERFSKGTDYSSDPEAFYVPWDIVEVDTGGTLETTLLSDGWINWLPVYDPSGNYIVYLKTIGYTGMFLMDTSGEELGQFVPNITTISYLDWK